MMPRRRPPPADPLVHIDRTPAGDGPSYHQTPRIQGFARQHPHCPRCIQSGRRVRLPDWSLVTAAGGLRCPRCTTVWYAVQIPLHELVYLAEVRATDLHAARVLCQSTEAVLRTVGAPMLTPPDPVPDATPTPPPATP